MKWNVAELSFDLVADLSSGPVVTVRIQAPTGIISAMAEPEIRGGTLILRGFNIESDAGANMFGIANLRVLAEFVMERMEFDELIVEGSTRTSGARPGRRTGTLRFSRRVVPAPLPEP